MTPNAWLVPAARLGVGGVTSMDTRVAGVTVTCVEPASVWKVAVTEADPALAPVAKPATETVTAALDALQVACAVTSL